LEHSVLFDVSTVMVYKVLGLLW